jgi:hypothetical protein
MYLSLAECCGELEYVGVAVTCKGLLSKRGLSLVECCGELRFMKAVVACEVVEYDRGCMCVGVVICSCRGERDVVVERSGCS